MLTVQKFTFNPFSENTYVVYADNKEAAIIDPGCFHREEEQELETFINDNKLTVKRLLNTHAHIDHVFGNQFCATKWGLPLELHEKDIITLKRMPAAAELWGIKGYKESPQPGALLTEGQKIKLGNYELDVVFVPGHAPGHVAFISHSEKFIIGGDCLFQGSIGRTDLPGGSLEVLMHSIKKQFLNLPDDYVVFSGHGGETTIGRERKSNQFILEYC
ncbi:MAG TPA: MBL fold metallo-hydrolase [Flavobacteriales bacterium]|nr:MBL fold metallo-hydrolase [Flavobacteriales bacterium]